MCRDVHYRVAPRGGDNESRTYRMQQYHERCARHPSMEQLEETRVVDTPAVLVTALKHIDTAELWAVYRDRDSEMRFVAIGPTGSMTLYRERHKWVVADTAGEIECPSPSRAATLVRSVRW